MMTHTVEITIPASLIGATAATEWLHRSAKQFCVPTDQCTRLDMCLDEAIANILMHSQPNGTPIELRLNIEGTANTGSACITLSSKGLPFNPIEVAITPVATSLQDAEPGGLGLLLIHSFSDELSYSYQNNKNQLSFCVRWADLNPAREPNGNPD